MELVLLSNNTLSNIGWREYTLTVNAMKRQLMARNKVSLAADGWTSMNKFAITSVIEYYIDLNWALREVQLAFDEIDSLVLSYLKSSLRITGQGSAYGSMASRTFEGSS
jgi:hypothetical protein